MKVIEIKIYKINEHPNKVLCYDFIRNNWLDLNNHSVDEIIDSIKKLSDTIGGSFDYSISQTPDSGEFINFSDYDDDKLNKLIPNDLPLTGVCWDADLINGLKIGNLQILLDILHSDTEHMYSNEGLFELCNTMEYDFKEDGCFYSN